MNLIDATNKIISQFGRTIVHEERFVNVLSDLSSRRTEPAVLKIIRSAIQDDLLKSVLNADVKGIEHQVATTTSVLSKQYGYDRSLVESIMFSLAIGYGTISTDQYNAFKALNNKSPKKQTIKPAQNNNPNSNNPNPTKNKKQGNNSNKRHKKINIITVKQIAALLWGVLGLLASPIAYALLICQEKWWPLPASLVIALIHFFTIVPVAIAFDNKYSVSTQHQNQALQGASYALFLFAILYWILFPFFFSLHSIQSYFGFFPNEESSPWIITIGFNLLCAGVLSSYLDENFNIIGNVKKQINALPSRKGFLTIVSIFIFAGILVFSIPLLRKINTRHKIADYNNKISAINLQKDSLKNERCKTERNLSFAQFKIGDSFSTCLSKINDGDEYTINKNTYSNNLIVNEEDYITIVDTIVHLKTDWNNEIINIDLYFTNHKNIALKFTPYETNGDSILASYTAKYGEPEYRLLEYVESEFELPNYLYYSDVEQEIKFRMTPKEFYWTYKNSLIYIYYDRGGYSIKYGMPAEGATITYFDRDAERVLKLHKAEQARKERAYEQRLNDSLQHVREEAERQRQEQKRQEELNHQKSMEQI